MLGRQKMSCKAIGFDLDDTLYDRGSFYHHIFDLMETTIVKTDVNFESFYEIFQRYSDIEYEKFIREGKSKDEYKIDRVIDTYKELGLTNGKEIGIIFNALYLYYRNRIEYRKGAENLLKLLKKEGYELFILTNGPSLYQRNKLNQLEIQKYIREDCWFISDEMHCSKPEKEIFKKVEEEIGYSGSEILYIGDNYVNDIEGANGVGWLSIYLDINQHKNIGPQTHVVKTIEEIIDRIDK